MADRRKDKSDLSPSAVVEDPTPEPAQEPARDANPYRPAQPEDVPAPPEEVEVVLNPDFEVSGEHPSSVAVTVAGLSADQDFTDDKGRVVVSSSPVKVPADVAKAFRGSPAVKVNS